MVVILFSYALLLSLPSARAFSTPLFQQAVSAQETFPTNQEKEIELPNFDELFGRIKQVSPLARAVIEKIEPDGVRGFDAIDKSWAPDLKWKTIEANKQRLVKQVEKIDKFQGLDAPILRFRSSFEGPCDGEVFANLIMNLEGRKKWDAQIDDVYEAYTVEDLDSANIAMGFKYGDCAHVGVGHCITKPNLGIDAREQLIICGMNDFADGSCVLWGTEMEEWHNHLFPPGRRVTRAKSHIFSTTLMPTGPNSFDVEYVLQLEIGGKIPTWMTTPIVVENVKKLFACAQDIYLNTDGQLERFLAEKSTRYNHKDGPSLLLTP